MSEAVVTLNKFFTCREFQVNDSHRESPTFPLTPICDVYERSPMVDIDFAWQRSRFLLICCGGFSGVDKPISRGLPILITQYSALRPGHESVFQRCPLQICRYAEEIV